MSAREFAAAAAAAAFFVVVVVVGVAQRGSGSSASTPNAAIRVGSTGCVNVAGSCSTHAQRRVQMRSRLWRWTQAGSQQLWGKVEAVGKCGVAGGGV